MYILFCGPTMAAILRCRCPVLPQRPFIQRTQWCAAAILRDRDLRHPTSIPAPLLPPSQILT